MPQTIKLVRDNVHPWDAVRAKKLTGDLLRVLNEISDGKAHLVSVLSFRLGIPENSVQSQLRHLRKEDFGAWNVQRISLTPGLSAYVLAPGEYERKK